MARQYKGPIFAHRHYAEIANLLRVTQPRPDLARTLDHSQAALLQWGEIVNQFVSLFARDNSRFDRPRFILASMGDAKMHGKDRR